MDDLLNLEEEFYQEGYEQGAVEGSRVDRIEGRVFGLERGFDKHLEMGCLHGQSLVWASRLPSRKELDVSEERDPESIHPKRLPSLPNSSRMEKHVRVLNALAEPDSISTENSEDAVSELEDRFKRALVKIKIIEKAIGEPAVNFGRDSGNLAAQAQSGSQEANIEDPSILHARH